MATFILYLVVALIPLGTRLFLGQFSAGSFQEYESAFLYTSDIALLIFAAIAIYKKRLGFQELPKALAAFLFFAFISVFLAPLPGLAIYGFVRIALLAFFAVCAARIFPERGVIKRVLAIFAVLAVLQSLIGIVQFKLQQGIGLGFFGESPISANDISTSKVAIGSLRLMRAYGTFPHPNVLGAFLALGLFSLFHFYLQSGNFRRRLFVSSAIFLVSIGLILSFSRAAWFVGFLGTLPFVLYGLYREKTLQANIDPDFRWRLSKFWFEDKTAPAPHKHAIERRSESLKMLAILLAINYFLFAIFGWAIFPRVQVSPTEPAVVYRAAYNKLGVWLIKDEPLGVGVKNQVFYARAKGLYEKLDMTEAWQSQPIHNLYLLMASEIGIFGLLSFLAMIFWIVKRIRINELSLESLTAVVFLGSLLLLGFFDHFLWTLWQGQLMLWLAIGFVLGLTPCNTRDLEESRLELKAGNGKVLRSLTDLR